MGRQTTQLTAPFPYIGGKSRFAKLILPRLGNPADFSYMAYAEPFSGSLAILLSNPTPFGREVVTDINGLISNFWRAMQSDPDAVAAYADYPTFHDDLLARHRWLVRWADDHRDEVREDADFYDAKAAGWWAWGISSWIGGGWCQAAEIGDPEIDDVPDGRPLILPTTGRSGVSAQRRDVTQDVHDKRPHMKSGPSGQGIAVQSRAIRDTIPMMRGKDGAGRGVSAQRRAELDKIPKALSHNPGGSGVRADTRGLPGHVGDGSRLLPWFRAIQQRLSRVLVLNRPWQSAVTPTVLMQHYDGLRGTRIIMDPPYRTDMGRADGLYQGDDQATDVAVAAYDWAVEHGGKFGIVYFCHEGDFEVPAGWDALTMSFGKGRAGARDMAILSPALSASVEQPKLI